MSETHYCRHCKTDKPLTEFYTKPNGQPRAGCKACLCAASRRRDPIYQKNHRARCNAKVRHWRKRNLKHARALSVAGVQRWRRRKRDRNQEFLPLDLEKNSPHPTRRKFPAAVRAALALASEANVADTFHAVGTAGASCAPAECARPSCSTVPSPTK